MRISAINEYVSHGKTTLYTGTVLEAGYGSHIRVGHRRQVVRVSILA